MACFGYITRNAILAYDGEESVGDGNLYGVKFLVGFEEFVINGE